MYKTFTVSLSSMLLVKSALTLQNNQGQFHPSDNTFQSLEPLVVITKNFPAKGVNSAHRPTAGGALPPSATPTHNEQHE